MLKYNKTKIPSNTGRRLDKTAFLVLNLSIIGEVENGNGEITLDGSLTDPKGWDHFDN